jgi:profilin
MITFEHISIQSKEMSWQAYVDQQLVGTGKVSRGAIFGLDGSTWAISPGFNVRL